MHKSPLGKEGRCLYREGKAREDYSKQQWLFIGKSLKEGSGSCFFLMGSATAAGHESSAVESPLSFC